MPEWQKLVKKRLKGIRVTEQEAAEIEEELADHLDSIYQMSLSQGATEQAAAERTLKEVSNWRRLRKEIELNSQKEATVNKRVSQFWFPALVTLFVSMILLMLIQLVGPDPAGPDPLAPGSSRWRWMAPVAVVYACWWATLPLVGALGAWLSRRAGAQAKTVLSAIVFPVLPF